MTQRIGKNICLGGVLLVGFILGLAFVEVKEIPARSNAVWDSRIQLRSFTDMATKKGPVSDASERSQR